MAPPTAVQKTPPKSTAADAEPVEGATPPLALVPDPKIEPEKAAAAKGEAAPEVDRLARIESALGNFANFAANMREQVGQMAHVIDRLASAPRAAEVDEPDHEERLRPDEHLADAAREFSAKELYRMLEIQGHSEEVARLRAEGIGHDTHWIANDCMAIGVIDATGKEVQTKVMPGEPIPREKLKAETIEWALKHPEGAKLVRPGEYRAPKPTASHTR